MRNDGDYQHRGGRGLGSDGIPRFTGDGMANICEPLTPALACGASVNVVRTNKPKVLNKVGLDQKVRG